MKTFVIAAALSLASAAAVASPVGEWATGDGSGRVKISQCGPALCGAVSGGADRSAIDSNNPDPAKKKRRILGMQILLGMRPAGANTWKGLIYNARNGQNYNATLTLQSERVLALQGCIQGGGVCGDQLWSRRR